MTDRTSSQPESRQLPFPEQAGLAELLEQAEAKYRTRFEPVTIGDHTLEVLQLADMEDYIDRLAATAGQEGIELPFWAKIWPTSVLLSHFILKLPADPALCVLEIGAGIGLCGLIAAKHGFSVRISDNHPDALLFARINILKNGLDDLADVACIDFAKDESDRRYPLILGSEVVYRQEDYSPLVRFLKHHLDTGPSAMALLAHSYGRQSEGFFQLAGESFHIQDKTIGYKERSDSDEGGAADRHLCTISKLTPRPPSPDDQA
jgi:predicted nicotinamide N-methyase